MAAALTHPTVGKAKGKLKLKIESEQRVSLCTSLPTTGQTRGVNERQEGLLFDLAIDIEGYRRVSDSKANPGPDPDPDYVPAARGRVGMTLKLGKNPSFSATSIPATELKAAIDVSSARGRTDGD